MNKVVTINLNGNAYQLDEAGYEALRAYLDRAAQNLAANPDREEIIADLEQAIASRCRAALGPSRTVVAAKSIESILADMGPVEDSPPTGEEPRPGATRAPDAETPRTRRLYRLKEGAQLGGVCNGLGAHFGIDPNLIRIVFVLLTVFSGGGALLAYVLFWLLVPEARTPTDLAAVYGVTSTAEDVVRRAKQGLSDGAKALQWKGVGNVRNVFILLLGTLAFIILAILSLTAFGHLVASVVSNRAFWTLVLVALGVIILVMLRRRR